MTKRGLRETIEGYLCISPWILGFALFGGGPIIASLALSFTKWNIIQPAKFVGLANYVRLLTQTKLFWHSLRITFTYAAAVIPLGIIIGFSIALLMNQKLLGLAVWRTIYYMPSLVTGVAIAMIWTIILNPEVGLVNQILWAAGIEGPKWLYDKNWALAGIILMVVWQTGGAMIIYLAGLQGIPTQLYEAVEIDGGGVWRKFVTVTIPMMTPILFFQLIMGVIGSLQVFGTAFIMTRGGPEYATMFYNLQLYFAAFEDFEMGLACSMAWILFLIILLLTLLLFKSAARWVYYAGERGR